MASTPASPARPAVLRSMNERATLGLLIANGPMTRVQLGEVTGLSAPTTSQLVARLVDAGLVDEAGRVTGSRGPDALAYRACTESTRGIALHVLPERIEACLVDVAEGPYPVAEIRLARERSAGADIAAAMDAACAAAGQTAVGVVAVCVGVPGAVSPDGEDLRLVGPLRGWPRHAVRTQLEEQLGVTVTIGNDANLAAVAEAHERPDIKEFALLWQGEGLRVASVANEQVRQGAAGGAGEVGYLPTSRLAASLDADAMELQYLAGAVAVTRLVRAHRPRTRTYQAALAALRHDELRPTLLAELAPRIAEVLLPVLAILDPALVILGGPTGVAIGPRGAGLVQAHLRRTTRWRTPVVTTAVPDHPVLRGAALTLAQHLTERILGCIG